VSLFLLSKGYPLPDAVDPLARRIGAVNTVWRKAGKWHGTNTDVQGVWLRLGAASASGALRSSLRVMGGLPEVRPARWLTLEPMCH